MTPREAERSIREALDLGLRGADFMASLGPGKVAHACNGAGPDRWTERVRRRITRWFWLFRVCFDVHDCEFAYANDGGLELFERANDHLEWNCRLVADARYGWYNPMRYLARFAGRAIAEACRDFGWEDWTASSGRIP